MSVSWALVVDNNLRSAFLAAWSGTPSDFDADLGRQLRNKSPTIRGSAEAGLDSPWLLSSPRKVQKPFNFVVCLLSSSQPLQLSPFLSASAAVEASLACRCPRAVPSSFGPSRKVDGSQLYPIPHSRAYIWENKV